MSVRLITAANVASSAAVIDIGGGTSRLIDALIEPGFEDLSVLDVSKAALVETQRRLAAHAGKVCRLRRSRLSRRTSAARSTRPGG